MDSENLLKNWGESATNEPPYTTKHNRVYRHLDFILQEALQDVFEPITLDEIRERIGQTTGVKIGTKTILKQLPKLTEKLGESPLCKVGDKYRLNRCLYNYARIKPPGVHKKYR